MLVEKGADVNAKNSFGETPAVVAAENDAVGTLRVLGRLGADFNIANQSGEFPIHRAAREGHVEALSTLLSLGARPGVKTTQAGQTALHLCAFANNMGCARILIEHGVPIDSGDEDGATPLIYAARQSNLDLVRFLLEKGASVNARDNADRTALIWAVTKSSSTTIVNALLQHGADPTVTDRTGYDALARARLLGHKDAEKVLLAAQGKGRPGESFTS